MTAGAKIKVYHFCNEEFGLQNILRSRLKVATIMDLNDPFEMMCLSSRDADQRKNILHLKKRVAEQFGMLCFSRTYVSPVQWGHYGNKHKGLCLGFDIDADRLHKVEYRRGRIKFDPEGYLKLTKDQKFDVMSRQLRIKHSEWAYEKEERQIVLLSSAVKDKNLYFKPFSEIGTLRQVIVGCNSELTRADIEGALGDRSSTVEKFKVRTAFESYKIVRNKNEELWK